MSKDPGTFSINHSLLHFENKPLKLVLLLSEQCVPWTETEDPHPSSLLMQFFLCVFRSFTLYPILNNADN